MLKEFKGFIKDYTFITVYMWAAYTLALTPAAFLLWKMTIEQWMIWWQSGLPLNFLLNYPIGRSLIFVRERLFKREKHEDAM